MKAGSVVFWDNRIPHGNAYRNDATPDNNAANSDSSIAHGTNDGDDELITTDILGQSGARAVVYCSFLPDIPVNRIFVQSQLEDWKAKRAPRVGDRWIRQDEAESDRDVAVSAEGTIGTNLNGQESRQLSELGKRLIGLAEWE